MLIRQFLTWAERASAGARAEAASALARAYLYADLDSLDQGEAERALTSLLDDPSPLVRRALAETFATAVDAPHHIVVALAADQSDIASLVLERSPVLGDAELIDAVAIGDGPAQCCVARRPRLSAAVAGALAEVGARDAALTLCQNAGAELAAFAAQRLIERFGDDGEIRYVLGQRTDVGPQVRHALVVATAKALSDFVTRCDWMTPERARRVVGEARDRATISIAAVGLEADDESGQRRFAAYLQSTGHLTSALILRGLLSGNVLLFEAALCELSGKAPSRVAGLVRNPGGLGFAALYKSAGLPSPLLAVFRAALAAVAEAGTGIEATGSARLHRRMIERVITACGAIGGSELTRLTALLRRFEAEAARDEVRACLEQGADADPQASPVWNRLASPARVNVSARVAA